MTKVEFHRERKLYPDLYQGHTSGGADDTSNSGTVKTTVTQIHRFSREDAVVLQGTIQNKTCHPVQFDGRATTVQVANEVHPAKLTGCLRPIPAEATVPIDVVIQGDIGGGRANLPIERVSNHLAWRYRNRQEFKNGSPGGRFQVPTPTNKSSIPLTQTGRPAKEVQQ